MRRTAEAAKTRDLVLVGGGHAHVGVLRALAMEPVPETRLTLINTTVETPYSGMLPGFVAGHYDHDAIHIDLRPLARFAGARFIHGRVAGLDPVARRLDIEGRPPIFYDVVSLDIGSAPDLNVPGAREHVVPVKPISRFVERWEAMLGRVRSGASDVSVVVVGAGAGGVELALAIDWRLRQEARTGGAAVAVRLVQGAGEILPSYPDKVRAHMAATLKERGIEVYRGCRVAEVRVGTLVTENGAEIHGDEIVWVTQAAAQPWLRETGLALDPAGFVLVDDCLRSTSHASVFAAGDVAHMVNHPREKAGVYAVRQGPRLTENLRRALAERPMKPFRPQSNWLSLISTGDRNAVGTKWGITQKGPWVWRVKDRIDRAFMERFQKLPFPDPPSSGGGVPAMVCGGCGSKVGSEILADALKGIEVVQRDDVLVGLDAPDDAAILSGPAGRHQVLSVDHFRAFLDDPYDVARIAAVHALGDVWAMGAAPQAVLATVTLPPLSPRLQARTLVEIMAGAGGVFREAGAALVGGHTDEGAELSIGFTVTGLVDRHGAKGKGGLMPGDVLVLTKPIGTGVLFAADMRGRARGRDIEAALTEMRKPVGDAATVFVAIGVRAMTDVTGFGLAGHLLEMLRAGGVSARLKLGRVPLFDGAAALAEEGIASSLSPANAAAQSPFIEVGDWGGDPRIALLHDPQTAGGLLAGVPPARLSEVMGALRAAGVTGAAIGTVEAADGSSRIVLE